MANLHRYLTAEVQYWVKNEKQPTTLYAAFSKTAITTKQLIINKLKDYIDSLAIALSKKPYNCEKALWPIFSKKEN